MATELETAPATAKFEIYVESELAKVRRRIRVLDAGRSLLLLAIVTLAYFLGMAAFDLFVKGANAPVVTAVRIIAFLAYGAAVVFFLVQFALRLYRNVNPYYAAKQLEDTLPDAKNSVINWVDLKSRNLPAAIRVALGLRAAHDIKQTDLEKAVDPKSTWLLGSILGVLVFGVLILFVMGPRQFGSLVNRAFAPFGGITLDRRTSIELIKPLGNVTIPLNKAVHFQAMIDGRYPKVNEPGSPRVLYRYSTSDSHVPLPLEEAHDGSWVTTLLADQVQNGFWYKIAAGDAETPEYQVQVHANPQAVKYEITYHYRPYLKLEDRTETYPNEKAGLTPHVNGRRGTEVTMVARTNRKLKEGRLELETKNGPGIVSGEILESDPKALRVKLVLEHPGTFRLAFTSAEGEENTDRMRWNIDVHDDEAPNVILTTPAKDVSLPANGTLQLEGKASDDVGVKSVTLRLKVHEGELRPALEPKVYRPGKSFQFDNGTYPFVIEYKDFLALDKIKTAKGEPFALKPGTVLEYWLEAVDNSDYPDPAGNVGRSMAHKVTVEAPAKDKDEQKQKEDRQKAEEKQKQHENKQDDQQAQQNKDRNDEVAKKKMTPEEKKQADDQAREQQQDRDNKVKDTSEKLEKEIKQQQKNDSNPAKAKGEPDQKNEKGDMKPGENSAENQPQSKDAKPQSPDKAGDSKPGDSEKNGNQGKDQQAGESKDKGPPQDSGQKNAGDTKGAGDQKPDPGAKGGDEKNQPREDPGKGQAKEESTSKEQPGQAKNNGGKKEDKAGEGQSKNQPPPQGGAQGGEAKGQQAGKDAPSAAGKDEKSQSDGSGKQVGEGQTKDGPKEQFAQNKASGKDHKLTGNEKSAGDAQNEPGEAQAQSKGKIDDPERAQQKAGPADGKNEPQAHAKKQDAKKGPAGDAKDADPEQAKDSGLTKGEKSDLIGKDAKPLDREPTAEEMTKLQDRLKRDEQAAEAMKELSRLVKESKDANVRKTAEDLMKESGRPIPGEDPKAKGTRLAKDGDQGAQKEGGKESPDGPPKAGQTKEGNPQQGDNKAKGDNKDDTQAAKAESKSPGQYGNFGEGGTGFDDEIKPFDPKKPFADRGGDMQLEDLKKQVTPEMLKKLNISDREWQQYQKDRAAYENSLRRQQAKAGKNTSESKGGASILPGKRPREIAGNPNAPTDPLQSGVGLPPPEFREAQQRFTNPQQPKGP
ncbi:MAG: hypothetical protein HY040_22880 [Planctomycetes bacterium]|nr:hypothetical protein [Planctomycetota bacterium]